MAAGELAAALGPLIAGVHDLLDFGCGSGRVLPHIAALAPQARGWGCDIDPDAVAWASGHLPQLRWRVNDFRPPLPFETESFDLVYSISVFSHLDEPLQDQWLRELRRVLRPGAIALLSVHGPHAFEQFRSGAVRTRWCRADAFAGATLAAGQFVFEPYVQSIWNRSELPGVGDGYGLAFHGRDYLNAHWSDFLEVVTVRERALSAWQDLVVCRNRIG